MYKQASKLKLRFNTPKGVLAIEQLWDLSLSDLDHLAVSLEDAYKNSKGKSFLEKKTTKDKGIKMQFDIVLDILQSKIDESESLRDEAEIRAHNAKIDMLIADKKDRELGDMTIEQLEKLRK